MAAADTPAISNIAEHRFMGKTKPHGWNHAALSIDDRKASDLLFGALTGAFLSVKRMPPRSKRNLLPTGGVMHQSN